MTYLDWSRSELKDIERDIKDISKTLHFFLDPEIIRHYELDKFWWSTANNLKIARKILEKKRDEVKKFEELNLIEP